VLKLEKLERGYLRLTADGRCQLAASISKSQTGNIKHGSVTAATGFDLRMFVDIGAHSCFTI
jgi:hypothetical protein